MTAIWKRTWRERARVIEWKEMEGGAEAGRKGGTILGWKWLRSPLVLTWRHKPTTFPSCVIPIVLLPFLPCACVARWNLHPLVSAAIGVHSFAINGSLAALRRITRWIAQSEASYILFRVGHYCQRPELSAVTWASSWLSFTLPSLMRPDSWGWSYSAGWMLCW